MDIRAVFGSFCVMSVSFWLSICEGHGDKRQGKLDTDGKLVLPNKINAELLDDHERQHLQEHLKEKTNLDLTDSSPEELAFHYFHFHDKNSDRHLDGTEMYQAFEHGFFQGSMKQINEQQKHDLKHNSQKVQSGFVRAVDNIFNETDTNLDGYLSYTEYSKSRKANLMLTASSKHIKEIKVDW